MLLEAGRAVLLLLLSGLAFEIVVILFLPEIPDWVLVWSFSLFGGLVRNQGR